MLVIAPELRFGGLTEHARCLALGAGEVGDEVVVVVPDVRDEIEFPESAQVVRADFTMRSGVAEIESRVAQADAVLLINSPQTGLLVPLLAKARAAAVGVHGSPRTNAAWLGQRLHALVAAACRSFEHLPILVPAAADRSGVAAEFGVPGSRVLSLPNSIDPVTDPVSSPPGCDRILAPVRISNEKVWLLDGAIELANVTGRDLTVVGVGPHLDDWRRRLRERCDRRWSLIEDPHLRAHTRSADVVVAAGMVALEAAQMGRRVAVPCKSGGWAGAVTLDSFQGMRDANFVLWEHPWTGDTRGVWDRVCSLSEQELAAISERIAVEASPRLMYERFRRRACAPGVHDPADSVVTVAEVLAEAQRVEGQLHKDYATILEARNYFEQQATNWETAYRDLEGAGNDRSERTTLRQRWRARKRHHAAGEPGKGPAGLALRLYNSHSVTLHSAAAYAYFVKKERRFDPRQKPSAVTSVEIRRNPSIPRMSWVARRRSGHWDFTVGEAVETSEHGFFEGVWDADFALFRPDLSEHRFGSGMIMTEAGPTFTCSFPGEPLYVVLGKSTHDAVVSNSPIFALTAAGIRPGDGSFDALTENIRERSLALCELGVERSPTLLSEDSAHAMHLLTYFNFRIREDGRIRRYWTVPRREFRTFAQYRELLKGTLEAVFRNGSAPGRRHRLTPVVPISRGYDSTACAAMAAEAGCRDAVTLDVIVEGRHDSGEANARALGLDVSVHRHVYGDDLPTLTVGQIGPVEHEAAEFIATAGRPGNIMYLPFEHRLRDRILISGAGGDSYWPKEITATSGLSMRAEYARGTVEFRLRVGFANLPLPSVGSRFIPSIAALNGSQEMAGFSVGGDYDRPVPRRIGEEAGLPRESFGAAKTAAAPVIADDLKHFVDAARVVAQRYEQWDGPAG